MKRRQRLADPEFKALFDVVSRSPRVGDVYSVSLPKMNRTLKKFLGSRISRSSAIHRKIEHAESFLSKDPEVKKPYSAKGLALYTTQVYREVIDLQLKSAFVIDTLLAMIRDLYKQIDEHSASHKGPSRELERKVRVAFTSPTLINKILDKAVDKYYSEFREESKKLSPYVG